MATGSAQKIEIILSKYQTRSPLILGAVRSKQRWKSDNRNRRKRLVEQPSHVHFARRKPARGGQTPNTLN
jgi:hypothetical protein